MSTVGDRLKKLRIERGQRAGCPKGFTSREVCYAIYGDIKAKDDSDNKRHAKEALYAQYEKGDSSPKYDDLIKFAKYYGVTTDYLLGASEFENEAGAGIKEITGLSQRAISNLERLKCCGDNVNEALNFVLEDPEFADLMIEASGLVIASVNALKYQEHLNALTPEDKRSETEKHNEELSKEYKADLAKGNYPRIRLSPLQFKKFMISNFTDKLNRLFQRMVNNLIEPKAEQIAARTKASS